VSMMKCNNGFLTIAENRLVVDSWGCYCWILEGFKHKVIKKSHLFVYMHHEVTNSMELRTTRRPPIM
jgi:hypothetical protein